MMIGVDIGTTNIKAVAVNEAGTPVATAERRTETFAPQPGWSEQDPEVIWQKVLSVMQEVFEHANVTAQGEPMQGLIFSSAMHGLIAVDQQGNPLTQAWLWSDLRADAIARQLRDSETGQAVYQRTGVPIHPMSPLCKVLWMLEHQPEIYRAAYKFLDIKSFVWHRLTGQFAVDVSCGSATGFMNIENNAWDAGALALAGIGVEKLPGLVATTHLAVVKQLPDVENSSPLQAIIGASDGALANLGSGATAPGQAAVTIGTSAAIRTVSHQPFMDPAMRTFCYRLDVDRCILGGASNNGTNALEWLRSTVFRSELSPAQFAEQAASVPPGADGLLFLPYLQGERAPLWDATASGAFYGLTSRHSQAYFVRAVMEGVLYNLKLIADALQQHIPVEVLYASGGFSQNAMWVQMLADVFEMPVVVDERGADASVLGAIRLGYQIFAGNGVDVLPDVQTISPVQEHLPAHRAAFQQFRQLVSLNFDKPVHPC